jgi:hypothetical protein
MPPETDPESELDSNEQVTEETKTPEEEPEFVGKKRHVSIFCPVCGMLCKARRYQIDHVFPNVMETFYGGRGKISREYLMDGDPAIPALQKVVGQKIIRTVMQELDSEDKQKLLDELTAELRQPVAPIEEEEELDDLGDFDDMEDSFLNQDFAGDANI